MGININSALLLYAAGSFSGAICYLAVVVFQQFMGSSLGRLFFSLDKQELIEISCYSGLWALIFMVLPYEKYRNLLISILPGLTYLTIIRGGFSSVLHNFDLSLFASYETPLVLGLFAIIWGLGIPKMLKQES